MTLATGGPGAAGSGASAARGTAAPGRPPRQAPTDLTLAFADEATVRATSAALGEPDWLLADRLTALGRFAALPIEANALYTPYVDLRTARLADVRPAATDVPAPVDPTTAAVPEGAAGIAALGEDAVAALALAPEARAAGVVLDTLGGLLRRDEPLLRRLLEASPLPDDDKLAQLTRALWSQGLVLHVPDGVRLERPVVLRWAVGAPARALLGRTLVSLGEDAGLSIVEEHVASSATDASASQALFAGTSEVRLGRAATLDVAGLQDFGLGQVAFQHRSAVVGQAATLRWALAQLGSRLVRSRIDNRLEGDGASVEQAEIVFGAADQLFDLTSYTRHVGRDTTGNLLSKAALLDHSRAYLKGLISIDRPAHGTDSFLGEFGMLLSKQARSVAIPSLEIDQPDCRRAAHSSSVGPIDETQLFYLESRGIPPAEARKFIILGFLEPVVARVPLASAQERVRDLLDAKWEAAQPAPSATAA
ncbi:MAG TPA: SufD family Fe-S cluster assembly protein [Candidatus Limnocylindrales bacterium]